MAAADGDVRIVRAGVERLDDLEPLTRSLHAHQLTVDPAIPGISPRDEEGWWRIRRERYRDWLTSEEGSFALIAETGDGIPVGYAVVTIHDEDDSHVTVIGSPSCGPWRSCRRTEARDSGPGSCIASTARSRRWGSERW